MSKRLRTLKRAPRGAVLKALAKSINSACGQKPRSLRLLHIKNPVKDFCWWDLDGVCSLSS
jgi:hypothetical protein